MTLYAIATWRDENPDPDWHIEADPSPPRTLIARIFNLHTRINKAEVYRVGELAGKGEREITIWADDEEHPPPKYDTDYHPADDEPEGVNVPGLYKHLADQAFGGNDG